MISNNKGFTLLEVMVALLIVTVSLGVLIQIATDTVRGSDNLRDSIIAQWVAENKASEIQLKLLPVASSKSTGTVLMGQRTWHWRAIVSPTPDSYVKKIDITVSKTARHKFPVAKLVSFTVAP